MGKLNIILHLLKIKTELFLRKSVCFNGVKFCFYTRNDGNSS